MSKAKHSHQSYDGPDSDGINHGFHRPYWKHAHRDWRLWVAVSLMLVALFTYVMTDDLARAGARQRSPVQRGDPSQASPRPAWRASTALFLRGKWARPGELQIFEVNLTDEQRARTAAQRELTARIDSNIAAQHNLTAHMDRNITTVASVQRAFHWIEVFLVGVYSVELFHRLGELSHFSDLYLGICLFCVGVGAVGMMVRLTHQEEKALEKRGGPIIEDEKAASSKMHHFLVGMLVVIIVFLLLGQLSIFPKVRDK